MKLEQDWGAIRGWLESPAMAAHRERDPNLAVHYLRALGETGAPHAVLRVAAGAIDAPPPAAHPMLMLPVFTEPDEAACDVQIADGSVAPGGCAACTWTATRSAPSSTPGGRRGRR
jgi:hypothetical protein